MSVVPYAENVKTLHKDPLFYVILKVNVENSIILVSPAALIEH
jgi:hypothetical protein